MIAICSWPFKLMPKVTWASSGVSPAYNIGNTGTYNMGHIGNMETSNIGNIKANRQHNIRVDTENNCISGSKPSPTETNDKNIK